MKNLFPSPVGESYFSTMYGNYDQVLVELFPSPIGESYFSMVKSMYNYYEAVVSVPYRGILFFNLTDDDLRDLENGFRPLSGNLIFQSIALFVFVTVNVFPSPIGESYFSIRRKKDV